MKYQEAVKGKSIWTIDNACFYEV